MEKISIKWKKYPKNGKNIHKTEKISIKWKKYP
jgi:hypothetical protein